MPFTTRECFRFPDWAVHHSCSPLEPTLGHFAASYVTTSATSSPFAHVFANSRPNDRRKVKSRLRARPISVGGVWREAFAHEPVANGAETGREGRPRHRGTVGPWDRGTVGPDRGSSTLWRSRLTRPRVDQVRATKIQWPAATPRSDGGKDQDGHDTAARYAHHLLALSMSACLAR